MSEMRYRGVRYEIEGQTRSRIAYPKPLIYRGVAYLKNENANNAQRTARESEMIYRGVRYLLTETNNQRSMEQIAMFPKQVNNGTNGQGKLGQAVSL